MALIKLVPKFFFMAVSGAGVVISDQVVGQVIVYLLVNESALAESIIIQLMHALKGLLQLR